MKFKINSEMEYNVLQPSTLILNIHALRTPHQTVLEEVLTVDPEHRIEEFTSSNSPNRFMRLQINKPTEFKISYRAVVDTKYELLDEQQEATNIPVVQMDGDVIPYLFPSRYCQSDKLQRLAYKQFGEIENAYSKVIAITEWIYNNIEYVMGSTNSHTSAFDTITERVGVCRDFAHLGIALCRALSIPARYYTGYAFKLNPPDFHACFEAYVGGSWIIFDATRLAPLNGLVKIATGRDAADAAVATFFGNVLCNYINVECDTVDSGFEPFYYKEGNLQGLSYQ
jgi:transglutaminase-like putative cysteine protease